ncbi:hypothetical protein SAMN05519103_02489 [Rhizobiales bacterium GAS113]|nr:hypothetical protein SAMN05519103_02489 [Rhizobiales bacterium GAS113]
MNVQDPNIPSAGKPFETVVALQQANLACLESWSKERTLKREDRNLAAIHEFLARAQQTGTVLDREADRRSAQAALDYWMTELALTGDENAQDEGLRPLASFDPATFPDLHDLPSPFKGLAAFAESDAAHFFGRQRAATELATKVGSRPFVVISGPSGSGKSSLIQAGLVPRLRRTIAAPDGQYELLNIATPGSRPLLALLKAVVPQGMGPDSIASLRGELTASPNMLADVVKRYHAKPVVLIFDQFEEIFSLQQGHRPGELQVFVEALATLGDQHHVVISIRDDYVAQLQRLQPLGARATEPSNQYAPPPLSPRQLKSAIERPAEAVGLRFEDGLVDELVKDVAGEPASLPLLQFTLTRLWEKKQRNRVTREIYREVGRPREALKKAADGVLEDLKLLENEEIVRRLFLRLVTPATETEFVRNPCTRATLWAGENHPPAVDRVLERFVEAGLLRKQAAPGDEREDDRFDVAHEALIRNWPWLVGVLQREWRDHEKLWRLHSTAKLWIESGGSPGYLLSGKALEDASQFRERSRDVDALLDASKSAEDKRRSEAEAERSAAQLKEMAAAKSLLLKRVILCVCLVSGLIAYLVVWRENNINRANLEEKTALLQQIRDSGSVNEANRLYARKLGDLTARIEGIAESVNHADLSDLKTFLREFGVPLPIVDRLALAPGAGSAPPGIGSTAQIRREDFSEIVPGFREVAPTTGGLTCSGVLWLGNADNSKVASFPSTLTGLKNSKLKVTANIRLRKDFPSADTYSMSDSLGIIPAGTEVVAQGDPKAFARPSGPQYWISVNAPAEVCSKVFIQYVGDDSRSTQISNALTKLGYQVQEAEMVATAKGKAEVRYFWDSDKAVAAKLAAQLSTAMPGTTVNPVSLVNWPYTKPPAGTLEAWLDLSGQ